MEMIHKLMFSFFKNPDLETITEYLTDSYLYSLGEAKKDAARICQRIEALKKKGVELEYNPFWRAYQVHQDETGLRVYDGPSATDAVYVAEGF